MRDRTGRSDFPGNLFRVAFAILAMFHLKWLSVACLLLSDTSRANVVCPSDLVRHWSASFFLSFFPLFVFHMQSLSDPIGYRSIFVFLLLLLHLLLQSLSSFHSSPSSSFFSPVSSTPVTPLYLLHPHGTLLHLLHPRYTLLHPCYTLYLGTFGLGKQYSNVFDCITKPEIRGTLPQWNVKHLVWGIFSGERSKLWSIGISTSGQIYESLLCASAAQDNTDNQHSPDEEEHSFWIPF